MDLSHVTIQMFWRLLVAAALGGLVGFERDMRGRAAGLRTNLSRAIIADLEGAQLRLKAMDWYH